MCPTHLSEIFTQSEFGVITYSETSGFEFECAKPAPEPMWDIIRQRMPACAKKQEPHKGFFNKTDDEILSFLVDEHRVTPSWIADETGNDRTYVSQRLKQLKEHGYVSQPYRGIWDLEADPREDNDVGE